MSEINSFSLIFTLYLKGVILVGIVSPLAVQSSPVKVSRPQAITVANLTNKQIQSIIQESPTRPSILQPNDQVLPPSIALYLPDPERNKSNDDFYLLAPYGQNEKSSSDVDSVGNVASLLSLDTLVRPPPLPSPDSVPIDFHSDQQQANKDKTSYSYNDRYDYYFPVKVVYDDNQKYGDQEIQLMEMQPPSPSNEPNYYDVKPKKVPKKYQPNKKTINTKSNGRGDNDGDGDDDRLIPIDNDGLVLDSEHQPFVTSQPVERFAPAPSYRDLTDADLNTGEYIPKYKFEQNTEAISLPLDSKLAEAVAAAAAAGGPNNRPTPHKLLKSGESSESNESVQSRSEESNNDQTTIAYDTVNLVDASKRVEFQMHGFNGPNSYKFGYDTGLG